ncbi:hypothetical protein DK26_09835 [Bosea sp. WAO]|uniref:hypothetical protein n=1 Tax=Bosea sp. WAO TaxID=406341 RepID=UPI000749D8E9|nr:hypothetical protein [Bosea sp. WAO]KUL95442.1 hypothetical protein DK26_09835 [Bosea sp. WAO]
MNTPARILFGVVVALAAIWGWSSEWGQLLRGRWSFTQSISPDTGTYFRLEVKVTYKGEPVDFDIVVGCNIRRTGYKDGSSSVEVGMVPVVFGKRMPDNKGLVVRPPDACGGRYIKEGWIPDDLLPVMVVYDDADTLAFGTAYMSVDAYASSLSELRFERATIAAATRQEFDTFRKEQTNLANQASWRSVMGYRCHAYARYRIPEVARDLVHQAWPADHPRYWDPGPTPAFAAALWDAERQRDIGGPFRGRLGWADSGESPANRGVARNTGGGQIGPPQTRSINRWGPSYYPVYSDNNTGLKMPAHVKDWPEYIRGLPKFIGQKVDFQNGLTRGLAYCYIAPSVPDSTPSPTKQHWESVRAWNESPALHLVDRDRIIGASPRLANKVVRFIERDEYFFDIVEFYLEGTRGDV